MLSLGSHRPKLSTWICSAMNLPSISLAPGISPPRRKVDSSLSLESINSLLFGESCWAVNRHIRAPDRIFSRRTQEGSNGQGFEDGFPCQRSPNIVAKSDTLICGSFTSSTRHVAIRVPVRHHCLFGSVNDVVVLPGCMVLYSQALVHLSG